MLVLTLLAVGGLALAEDVEAQDSPFVHFGKEPEEAPRYLEGQTVLIEVDGVIVEEGDEIRVSCQDCPESDRTFRDTFSQSEASSDQVVVEFPDDFPVARDEGQPRWNGTWEVTVDDGHTRTFDVFLADEFRIPTDSYRPGQTATFQASGYPWNTLVNFTVYHAPKGGSRTEVWTTERFTEGSFSAAAEWRIPPSVATHLDCPNLVAEDCHRFEVEVDPDQGEKPVEVTGFRLDPATIRVDHRNTTFLEHVNRTETVDGLVPLRYHGSVLAGEPKTLGPIPARGDVLELDVHFQRLPDTCGGGSVENVTTVEAPVTFSVAGFAFVPEFVPPRDMVLETAGTEDSFRWAVAEQEDAYGNRVPYQPLGCLDVDPYTLTPTVHDVPEEFERARTESFLLNLTYADGTPLEAGDNTTILEGALQPLDDEGQPDGSAEDIELVGEHVEGGIWRWTHKLPKDFPELGSWRFEFRGDPFTEDGAEDEWGNAIATNATRPFPVVPASPFISLQTTVDGETRNASRGLDRGDTVRVQVTTTYPDGASLNASDLHEDLDGELPVEIIRKDEQGTVTGVGEMGLRELNPTVGTWAGTFDIPKVAAGAPVGTWDLRVTVRDNVTQPNHNTSAFQRNVNPDTLHVSTHDPPPRNVDAGNEISWAFVVRDGDGEVVTDERTGDERTGTITVDVRKWNNGRPGDPVVSGLEPNFDPDRGFGSWVIEWTPPRHLDPAKYLFDPTGTDIHGNVVADRARSIPFQVHIQKVPRDTIIAPPLVVERGENVTVLFDGRDGDVGPDGTGDPVIALERLTRDGRWVTEEQDVREGNRTGAGDHLGSWSTVTSTPRGEYRFHMQGRAHDGSIIDATSRTFEVQPQEVTRTVLEPFVPFASKGTTVTAVVAKADRFDRLDADAIDVEGPEDVDEVGGQIDVVSRAENWTVSWTIPLTAPQGQYVVHLVGQDRFGNNITGKLGPVRAGPVNLTVEPLELPRPDVSRTDSSEFVFRVTYPDDQLMTDAHGTPEVIVTRGGTSHTAANVTFDGINWVARWTPPADANRTRYAYQVGGQDKADNNIISIVSRDFRVTSGVLEREVREGLPDSVFRLEQADLLVDADADDRFVEFELEYHGETPPSRTAGPGPPEPVFTGRLQHEWRPSLGAYEVSWTPPKDQDVGHYRVVMTGEDVHGNRLETVTDTFQVRSTTVQAIWVDEIEEIPLGEEATYRLELHYLDGTPMTDVDGEPTVFVELNGRPVEPRPDVRHVEERIWEASWEWPSQAPPGNYRLGVRGEDVYGNPIASRTSDMFLYEPGAINQLTGATVPGPGAALAVVAAGVTALALNSRVSRR